MELKEIILEANKDGSISMRMEHEEVGRVFAASVHAMMDDCAKGGLSRPVIDPVFPHLMLSSLPDELDLEEPTDCALISCELGALAYAQFLWANGQWHEVSVSGPAGNTDAWRMGFVNRLIQKSVERIRQTRG